MLCQLVLLVLLSLLQPGRLQEEGCDDCSLFQNINNNIVNLNSMIRSYIRRSEHFRAQMEESMTSLREDLSNLNDSVSNLSTCLQEHKQQVNTRLDTLTPCNSEPDSPTQITISTPVTATTSTIPTTSTTPTTTPSPTIFPHTCGGTGGWRRAVYLDITNSDTFCPSGWQLTGYSKRTCGRVSTGSNICDSVTFPVSGGEYNRVCGRIKAYQWGATDAFYGYHHGRVNTIDDNYVAGVSVTHGRPRQHIWTFAVGAGEDSPTYDYVCPCDADHTIRIPPFVGNDYFCESGVNEPWGYPRHRIFHPNDTLWDGENCLSSSTCCSLHNPPYFVKQLPTPTTDDIEARICLRHVSTQDDIAVELVEFYVQ